MGVALLLITVLFLVRGGVGQANIGYVCPRHCRCATLPDRLDAVQIVCHPSAIRKGHFSVSNIPAKYTTWLTISCTVDLLFSYLHNGTFSLMEHLEELVLLDCVFPNIPRNAFSGLESLKRLNISRSDENYTPTIPEPGFLDPLLNLEVLHVPMAKIHSLPKGYLCRLSHLKHIEMAVNDKSVVNGFQCVRNFTGNAVLPGVTFLNLNSNNITNIDLEFRDLVPNLEILGLADNNITHLPSTIFQGLLHLRNLHLENNPLRQLTKEVFQELTSLEILFLQNTQLSYLDPHTFADNTRLWLLILFNNRLDDLTFHGDSTGGVLQYTQHLSLLDLSFNNITNISDLFFNTQFLTQLDLGGNAISTVPVGAFADLAMLQLLNLTRNPLHDSGGLLSGSLAGLQRLNILDLSRCMLPYLTDDLFEDSQNLQQLYLADNNIFHIPESLKTLGDLQILDFNGNKLLEARRELFSQMRALQVLKLSYNRLTYLPKALLKDSANLQEIYMEGNRIELLEYGTFEGLDNLKILDLSRNKITNIDISFYILPKLAYIFLSHNRIVSINKWCFPASTKVIFLQHNKINSIEIGTFAELRELQVVHLEHNRLSTLSTGSIQISQNLYSRPEFYLSGNIITCDCRMSWILDINSNSQGRPFVSDLNLLRCDVEYSRHVSWLGELRPDDYLCEWDIKCDQLSCNCCWEEQCNCRYRCPAECSCYQNTDQSLELVDCSNRNLTVVPSIPSVATLVDLDGNDFKEIPTMSFQNNSRIKVLSLNDSNIEVIQDGAFTGLSQLRSLWLHKNEIQNISSGTFTGLTSVKNISLHLNAIESVSPDAFDSTETLTTLTLHHNMLVEVELENFLSVNGNLTHLTLSHNPWSCNCSFGPAFQKWVRKNIETIGDANRITCAQETIQAFDPLAKDVSNATYSSHESYGTTNETESENFQILHMDFSHCKPNNTRVIHQPFENKRVIIALSLSGCIFLLVLTIALLIYSSRELLKVWLYNRYGFRFKREDESLDGKRYDAFVSYSEKDQKFVTKALVPKLEKVKPHYHLCLNYRDWPIGGSIAQTICESVEQSRRTIILLSQNFIKSEWCQYEFKAAHYRVLHDKTIRLIVILLDDKPPENLDPELRLYIKTNTYLQWKDPWFWEKLKYALPDVDREPRPSGMAYYDYLAGRPVTIDREQSQKSITSEDSEILSTEVDDSESEVEEQTDDEAEEETVHPSGASSAHSLVELNDTSLDATSPTHDAIVYATEC